ncbi:MAG: vWA domain-containing protein [Nitrososphaerales archaeon]
MSLYDHAWSRTFEIAQKKPAELKLLLSSRLDHPRLIRNNEGYSIVLAKPRKKNSGGYTLHGLDFPEPERGALLQMFNASIYHLAIHTVSSDYTIYRKWSENKERHTANITKSLVEDAAADAYLKAYWSGIRPIIAYANALTYIRLRSAEKNSRSEGSIYQAVLSLRLTGMIKEKTSKKNTDDAENIMRILADLEKSIYERCVEKRSDTAPGGRLEPSATAQERLDSATNIWEVLHNSNSPTEILALPYGEDWGGNGAFNKGIDLGRRFTDILKAAYSRLDIEFVEEEFSKEQARCLDEAIQVFEAQAAYDARMRRSLKQYMKLGQDLHFKSYCIPVEDYSEYARVRSKLAGPIRRILDELRKVKQAPDESPLEDSGAVDLQAAIQVMSSGSMRNDIFVKEELLQKSEAWGILIDSSLSLGLFEGDVRSIAVCLAEVAKNMISTPDSWGLFAFNDTFQIIKDVYEPFSNSSRAKIGGLQHKGLSFLPDAIELTAKALAKTSEDIKILLIITDGVPVGYSSIEQKFIESIKKAQKFNITPIIIGIGNKNVKRLLKTSCTVENTYEMMNQFVKLYLEAQAYI